MQPILTIDLTTGVIDHINIPPAWVEEYLGGASVAARLLYKQLTPDLDPLSPEAPLLFVNGPLSGTAGPAVGRYVICGKSPATGLWGESNCGGFWGPSHAWPGTMGSWSLARPPIRLYLWIHNNQVELLPGKTPLGLDTYQTQERYSLNWHILLSGWLVLDRLANSDPLCAGFM
jgi:aldehyde:ferredoxin oxidoreductase